MTSPRWVCGATLWVAAFFGTGVCLAGQAGAVGAGHPATVSTVVRRPIPGPVWLVGATGGSLKSVVASQVEGIVKEFLVHEGQIVERGARLAVLNTRTLENQLAAARARQARHESEVAELRRGRRPEEINQAEARQREAEARVALAKSELERQRKLVAKKAASQQSLEQAQARYWIAEALLAVAKNALALARQGERQEKRDQSGADLAAAQADVKRLEDLIAMGTVRAPFAGHVTKEHTQVGQWIDQGGAVAELIQLDPIHVSVPVPERYISKVATGQMVQVRVGALDQSTRTGKVVRIIGEADADARTFPVRIEVANPGRRVKAGMFARVQFLVGPRRPALLVPAPAVRDRAGKPVVYTVGARRRVAAIPVHLGDRYAGLVEVTGASAHGAIAPGMRVIVGAHQGLRPGQKVRIARTVPVERYLTGAEPGAPTSQAAKRAPAPGKGNAP